MVAEALRMDPAAEGSCRTLQFLHLIPLIFIQDLSVTSIVASKRQRFNHVFCPVQSASCSRSTVWKNGQNGNTKSLGFAKINGGTEE
jgi:hypothetical protein